MIDRALVDRHPVSRLAATYLRLLKVPVSPLATPLLALARAYLETLPVTADPNSYREDLRQEADRLLGDPQDWVASLFVPDQETFQRDYLEAQPGQEWEVLSDHLERLRRELNPEKSALDVGKVLAENLFSSLQHLSPAFGPQSS